MEKKSEVEVYLQDEICCLKVWGKKKVSIPLFFFLLF